jgi:iron complex outermembrane receptor protein
MLTIKLRVLLSGVSVIAIGCVGFTSTDARAESAAADSAPTDTGRTTLEEVVVTSTKNLTGVIEKRDSDLTFGFDKPLVETPRSVTAISDQLLDRYNIKSVYDFTAVAAGTYTGSYFGVPGSINIRGTIADDYFNGFQMITNFATYPTPVDASSSIDLVRGPPSPAFGAGQVGGLLNFIPKSASGEATQYLTGPTGAASITAGSYNQKEATAEGGVPLTLGGNHAGIYGFVEATDSGSFYIGEHPESQLAQITFDTELGPDWRLSTTAQYVHSDGYLKNIGWNRVTQALIDNSTYTSGTALAKIVAPGASYITPAAFAAAVAQYGEAQQYVLPLYGDYAKPNPLTELNPATVKTVQLSPRVTEISHDDINKASTPLLYIGSTRTFGDTGTVKLESFTQHLQALNYQSYGFATQFRDTVNEERVSYIDARKLGSNVHLQSLGGFSYRYTDAYSAQYLLNGVNIQDRWDLSQPQTPDEIFNAVFGSSGRDGYNWDNATVSHQSDIAAFLLEDALFFDHLDITGGVRNDNYSLHSVDTGTEAAANGAVRNQWYSEHNSPVSYNVSLSFKNPWAVPYFTYARSYSLNVDQGDALIPALLAKGTAVGTSTLREIGIKTSQLNGRLYAAVDGYRQQNEYLDSRDHSTTATLSEGLEGEMRYLVTRSLGLTSTVTLQHVKQLGAGDGSGAFLVITPEKAGITGAQGYGGQFETNAKFLGLANGYELHTTPRISTSLFATYDWNGRWGATAGAAYNSWTGGSIPGSIRLPGYALVKAGAYASYDGVRLDFYIDNLFDQRYFIAEYDVDSNATVLPGVGREFHVKISMKF